MKRKIFNVYNTSNTTDNLSRTELLEWINKRLGARFSVVNELCTGAAYCQLMDYLFPDSVALKRVKFMTNVEQDFLHNFKILQTSFNKIGLDVEIPVEKLIKGRFQDNFQFLQWFYKFYDANWGWVAESDYDARAVRKGAPMGFGPAAVTKNRQVRFLAKRRSSLVVDTARSLPSTNMLTYRISMDRGPIMKITPRLVSVNQQEMEEIEIPNTSSIERMIDQGLCSADHQKQIHVLEEEIQKLSDKLKCKEDRLLRSELECEYYRSMCHEVENLCQSLDEQGGTVSCDQIYKILYTTGIETKDDSKELLI